MRRAAPLRAASAPALTHSLASPLLFEPCWSFLSVSRAPSLFLLPLLPASLPPRRARPRSRLPLPSSTRATHDRSSTCTVPSPSNARDARSRPLALPASPSLCRSAGSSFRVSVARRRCAARGRRGGGGGGGFSRPPRPFTGRTTRPLPPTPTRTRALRSTLPGPPPPRRRRCRRRCRRRPRSRPRPRPRLRFCLLSSTYAFARRGLRRLRVAPLSSRFRQDLAPFTCARPPISTPSNLVARCPYLGRVTKRRSPPPLFEDTVLELGVVVVVVVVIVVVVVVVVVAETWMGSIVYCRVGCCFFRLSFFIIFPFFALFLPLVVFRPSLSELPAFAENGRDEEPSHVTREDTES